MEIKAVGFHSMRVSHTVVQRNFLKKLNIFDLKGFYYDKE